jgi:hypothetical protein
MWVGIPDQRGKKNSALGVAEVCNQPSNGAGAHRGVAPGNPRLKQRPSEGKSCGPDRCGKVRPARGEPGRGHLSGLDKILPPQKFCDPGEKSGAEASFSTTATFYRKDLHKLPGELPSLGDAGNRHYSANSGGTFGPCQWAGDSNRPKLCSFL